MYAVLGLPTVTIFVARWARRIGAFGLVGGGLTKHYHATHARHLVIQVGPRWHYQSLPSFRSESATIFETFTISASAGQGTHTDSQSIERVAGIRHQVAGLS